MEHYAGIDVSLELSSVCVVDGAGKIVKEAKVASEPEALVYLFKELGFPVNRIGFEAGPLSQWLHAGLTQAGFEAVLLETRHVKAALSAMTVKTDRKDACGLAQLLRMGWFQQVHAKSIGSQELRALLVARKQLLGRLLDVELSIRGILRGFGLKVRLAVRRFLDANQERALLRITRKNLIISLYPALRVKITEAMEVAPELVRFVRPPSALRISFGAELALHQRSFEQLKLVADETLQKWLPVLLKMEEQLEDAFRAAREGLADDERQIGGLEFYGTGGKHYSFKNIVKNSSLDLDKDATA